MLTSPRYGIGHFYKPRHFYQYPQRVHVFVQPDISLCVLHYCIESRIMTFNFYVVSERHVRWKQLYTSTPAVRIPPNRTYCSKEYETCIFPPLHITLSSTRFASQHFSHDDSNITASTGRDVLLPLPCIRERIANDCPLSFSPNMARPHPLEKKNNN